MNRMLLVPMSRIRQMNGRLSLTVGTSGSTVPNQADPTDAVHHGVPSCSVLLVQRFKPNLSKWLCTVARWTHQSQIRATSLW